MVERWWGYAPEIEPRVGGAVTFGAEGRVTEFDEGRVFAYAEDGMVTRWELAESGGTTMLTFVQSGFGPDELDNAAQHEAGWRGGLLELRRMHELGDAWERASTELPE
ncbi:MAG TPA: SRPBCC domain-containing protein [Actinophytocola sp.]|nr:SRPBCC domain-containing protein [Actinophytocola sp.]